MSGSSSQALLERSLETPDYPETAIAHFIAALKLDFGKRVLDLGVGSGELSRALQEKGVLLVHEKSAESVDCVVVGRAVDEEKTVREIARVLKPRGKVGLIWVAESRAPGNEDSWKTAFESTTVFGPLLHLSYSYCCSAVSARPRHYRIEMYWSQKL